MHRSFVALALVFISSPASAERTRGDRGSDTGRLGKVTSGIKHATDHGPSTPRAPDHGSRDSDDGDRSSYVARDEPSTCCPVVETGWSSTSTTASPGWSMPRIAVGLEGSAGLQKVYESGGSLSAALAVVFAHRFRLGVRAAHYFENETSGDRVAMTMPSFTIGARIGDLGPTRLWIDGGMTYLHTIDPAGDARLYGTTIGATVSRDLTPQVSLIGGASAMLFDEIQAYSGRVAVRVHHIELAFSALDFSVGPALFGPELGIGF